MPREIQNWGGKDVPPPARAIQPPPAAAPLPAAAPAAPQIEPAATPCPLCGEAELRRLASGALKCGACAAVFAQQAAAPPPPAPPPPRDDPEALDQIEAIDTMLRRNALVLGPGGVPLAEARQTAGRTARPSERGRRGTPVPPNRRNSR